MLSARAAGSSILPSSTRLAVGRHASSASPSPSPANSASHSHRIVVLLRSRRFSQDEIAVVDPAAWHHYQPGWTLVGGGLKAKNKLRRPLQDLLNPRLKFYRHKVDTFYPDRNSIMLGDGRRNRIRTSCCCTRHRARLGQHQRPPPGSRRSLLACLIYYGYEFCDKAFETFKNLRRGTAIFTHPTGTVKCAGAPQKIMWLALDYWKKVGLYTYSPGSAAAAEDSPIKIKFATGLASLFGVPKYSAVLEQLRIQRGVEGCFQHDLVAIEGNQAVFNVALPRPEGDEGGHGTETARATTTRKLHFDLLHVAGYVDVDEATTRHRRYPNIWSAGDASSLPTSKTIAAITAQAPVLVHNMLKAMDGKAPDAVYDGYTSCPLLTEYGKVLLAEFKYGGQPSETFHRWFGIDQAVPRRTFYHLKKDFSPWVYY
ncbi:hypothetical protein BDW66DRAFT_164441 [Aspergillus desertorum]